MAKKPEAPATDAIREAIRRQAETRQQRAALLVAAQPIIEAGKQATGGDDDFCSVRVGDIRALAKAAGV